MSDYPATDPNPKLRDQLADVEAAAKAYQLPRLCAVLLTLLRAMVERIERIEKPEPEGGSSHGK